MSDHEHQHAHPTAKKYLGIAIILTFITVIEVAVFYIPSMHHLLPPVLLTLSALKFALVAMFYMHLKTDGRLLSTVFVFSLVIAAVVITALMLLFAYLHHVAPTKMPGGP